MKKKKERTCNVIEPQTYDSLQHARQKTYGYIRVIRVLERLCNFPLQIQSSSPLIVLYNLYQPTRLITLPLCSFPPSIQRLGVARRQLAVTAAPAPVVEKKKKVTGRDATLINAKNKALSMGPRSALEGGSLPLQERH